jgi:hypothetical protein
VVKAYGADLNHDLAETRRGRGLVCEEKRPDAGLFAEREGFHGGVL